MKELSLHILDLVQNSLHANANLIEISIDENSGKNSYLLSIKDNGAGMNNEVKEQILNPFFTTKNKKTGLGIPLLKQHAELTNGFISIESDVGIGTEISAFFERNHLDRQPLGDMAGTITSLIRANPQIDFEYSHKVNKETFKLSTKEVKNELDDISISSPEIVKFLHELITENLKAIEAEL